MISVVIPIQNNSSQLRELISKLKECLLEINIPYEIILVDDASSDNSLGLCKQLQKENNAIKVIALPQINGQHKAIYKGLQKAKGGWVVIMHADGQDDPSLLKKLYESAQNGYHAVLVKKSNARLPLFHRLTRFLFYFVWQILGQKKASAKLTNYGMYNKSLIDAVLSTKFPPFSMQLIALKLNAPTNYITSDTNLKPLNSSISLGNQWKLGMNMLYLYAYKSLRRLLFIGIVFVFLANSILVRYLLKGHSALKWPFLDTLLISFFMLIGAFFLLIFFSSYNIKKRNIYVE
jgi:glycosyltransferase involved in cell wall biosynthesis